MRKILLKFLGVVLIILLAFVSCTIAAFKFSVTGCLPGLIDKKSYHSYPGRDSVECKIYMYEDTKELR